MELPDVPPSLPFNVRVQPELFPHQVPSQPIFRNFRMSNNFLLNNSQCLLMMGVLLLAQALSYGGYRLGRRGRGGDSITARSQSQRLMVFLLNRIYTVFESSFLITMLSVLLQLQSVNFESFANGLSLGASLAFAALALRELNTAYQRINQQGASRLSYASL